MKIGITVLGSGSGGNAILVRAGDDAVLIDAGFSRKEMLARLAASGIDPKIVTALLITHDHGDHVRGARVLADHLDIPTYLNAQTLKHLRHRNLVGEKVSVFTSGTPFAVEPFEIHPFPVPHDAMEPVGFAITVERHGGERLKIGIATDLGHVNNLVRARLSECDALLLECNHDLQLLRESDRKLSLKRRIGSKFGHLNNDDSINAIAELAHDRTRHIFLCHLSDDCNDRALVAEMASAKLAEIGREDISLNIAVQDHPLDTVWL